METLEPRWRKSSYSDNGGNCLEVASDGQHVSVRDTEDHGRGPVCRYTPGQWRAFIAGLRSGELDLDGSGHLP